MVLPDVDGPSATFAITAIVLFLVDIITPGSRKNGLLAGIAALGGSLLLSLWAFLTVAGAAGDALRRALGGDRPEGEQSQDDSPGGLLRDLLNRNRRGSDDQGDGGDGGDSSGEGGGDEPQQR